MHAKNRNENSKFQIHLNFFGNEATKILTLEHKIPTAYIQISIKKIRGKKMMEKELTKVGYEWTRQLFAWMDQCTETLTMTDEWMMTLGEW